MPTNSTDEISAEDISGPRGFPKEMSYAYHAKEKECVAAWVKEADIVITTALIQARPAPRLIYANMLSSMKPGSVILDMAAAPYGGNCEFSKPNEVVVLKNGVKILGFTDLPSRAANTASQLFGDNVANFLLSVGPTTRKQYHPHELQHLISNLRKKDGIVRSGTKSGAIGSGVGVGDGSDEVESHELVSAEDYFYPDYRDPAVREMLVVDQGRLIWPNPSPYQPKASKPPSAYIHASAPLSASTASLATSPAAATATATAETTIKPASSLNTMAEQQLQLQLQLERRELREVPDPQEQELSMLIQTKQHRNTDMVGTSMVAALLIAGAFSPDAQTNSLLAVFLLSSYAAQAAVYNVKPALHSLLVAITNAISGLTVVAGIQIMLTASSDLATALGAFSAFVSFVNIFGGFQVSAKMLDGIRHPSESEVSSYGSFCLPAALVVGGSSAASAMGLDQVPTVIGMSGAVASIASIGALSDKKTAKAGNLLAMTGVLTVLVSTLSTVWVDNPFPSTLVDLGAVGLLAGGAAIVGISIAQPCRELTELPQTVAGFHSLVGLAATATAIAQYVECASGQNMGTGELIATFTATCIGGVTATGSVVASAKLSEGNMGSKPLDWPIDRAMLISFIVGAIGWLTATTLISHDYSWFLYGINDVNVIYIVALLSGMLGATLTSAISAADIPIVITLLNSYSGWALCTEGFLFQNPLLTSVGALIGFSGGCLAKIMCGAVNRDLLSIVSGSSQSTSPLLTDSPTDFLPSFQMNSTRSEAE